MPVFSASSLMPPDVPQGGGDEGRIVAAFLQAGLEVKPTCPAKSKGLAVSS
jgi:hypothetical protein